jgi:acyl-coenzyme A thioesterase PaaI-like protein
VVGEAGANIDEVHHQRAFTMLAAQNVEIELVCRPAAARTSRRCWRRCARRLRGGGAMMDKETLQRRWPNTSRPGCRRWAAGGSFDADSVTLRLPQSDQLSRVGGMLCGQAMMAAADTAMVLALINQFGEFRPCTTVQMNTSFLKPLSGQDALVQARVVRAGKSLAFGEIDIRGGEDGKSVCRASTTYALLL